MIDTVILLIPKDKVSYFYGESSWDLYSKTDQYEKYVRNPSKVEKDTGKYFPRLTEYKRRFSQDANIRMEFSVPKLLFLNNLDELEEKDFLTVINILQERLRTMGVIISKTILENAQISSVHFSKNIPLMNGYTSNFVISEINKINLRKSFDFAKTRFANDGQSLYFHTTSHQFVIYDKIADLNKDKKRAIDKEQTLYQMNLFDELNNQNQLQEIIRFEIRLNHKQKLNKLLEELGYKTNPVFRDVFSCEMSKKVVTQYWNRYIRERNLGILSISLGAKDIFQTLLFSDANLKPKQAIYMFGLFMLAKDENGMRQLRTIITKRARDRTWYRIVEDMQTAGNLITKNNLQNWVTQIDKQLELYKSYKIKK